MINIDGNTNKRSKIYSMDGSIEEVEANDYTHQKLSQIAGYNFLGKPSQSLQNIQNVKKEEKNTFTYPEISKKEIEKSQEYNNAQQTMKQIDQLAPTTNSGAKSTNLLEDIIAEYEKVNASTLNDFLKTQAGKVATIQFMQGDNLLNKIGVILSVGDDYILLYETETDTILVGNLNEIKFINLN